MKVDEYMVIDNTTLSDLEKQVNNLICEGWEPTGGISVCKDDVYYQAMIKYEPTKNVTYIKECA